MERRIYKKTLFVLAAAELGLFAAPALASGPPCPVGCGVYKSGGETGKFTINSSDWLPQRADGGGYLPTGARFSFVATPDRDYFSKMEAKGLPPLPNNIFEYDGRRGVKLIAGESATAAASASASASARSLNFSNNAYVQAPVIPPNSSDVTVAPYPAEEQPAASAPVEGPTVPNPVARHHYTHHVRAAINHASTIQLPEEACAAYDTYHATLSKHFLHLTTSEARADTFLWQMCKRVDEREMNYWNAFNSGYYNKIATSLHNINNFVAQDIVPWLKKHADAAQKDPPKAGAGITSKSNNGGPDNPTAAAVNTQASQIATASVFNGQASNAELSNAKKIGVGIVGLLGLAAAGFAGIYALRRRGFSPNPKPTGSGPGGWGRLLFTINNGSSAPWQVRIPAFTHAGANTLIINEPVGSVSAPAVVAQTTSITSLKADMAREAHIAQIEAQQAYELGLMRVGIAERDAENAACMREASIKADMGRDANIILGYDATASIAEAAGQSATNIMREARRQRRAELAEQRVEQRRINETTAPARGANEIADQIVGLRVQLKQAIAAADGNKRAKPVVALRKQIDTLINEAQAGSQYRRAETLRQQTVAQAEIVTRQSLPQGVTSLDSYRQARHDDAAPAVKDTPAQRLRA